MDKFFEMGGYAAFVWPAYVLSLATLAALAGWTLRANARAKKRLGLTRGEET